MNGVRFLQNKIPLFNAGRDFWTFPKVYRLYTIECPSEALFAEYGWIQKMKRHCFRNDFSLLSNQCMFIYYSYNFISREENEDIRKVKIYHYVLKNGSHSYADED